MKAIALSLALVGCGAAPAELPRAEASAPVEAEAGSPTVVGCILPDLFELYPCSGAVDPADPVFAANPSGAVRTPAGNCPAVTCEASSPCQVWESWQVGWKQGVCGSAPMPTGWKPGQIVDL